MPPLPDPPDPLTDGIARLRLAAERDIPEVLIAHQDDPTLYRRLGLPRPPSGAELGRRAEAAAAERAAGQGAWLTILDARADRGDECRGQIEVDDVDRDHRRAELRIWIAPAARGRGLAASALALAGRWLIADCGLERVQLLADPEAAAFVQAAETAGFTNEGVLREYLRDGAGRADVAVLSLVAADLT